MSDKLFKHLKIGWDSPDFESTIQKTVDEAEGYDYYDIKVDSKGSNCLVILKKK
jgi:hypothetical protein